MTRKPISLFYIFIALAACNDDTDSMAQSGDNSKYTGSYDCTKSNNSFEDDTFITEIEDVVIESDGPDTIVLDGVSLPIMEDGTTGPITVENKFYNLRLTNDSLHLLTYPHVPGLAIQCYIKGKKQ